MKIVIAFIGVSLCLLFFPGYALAQKKASRLAGECRYHVYADARGKEYIVAIDSVHYGYNGGRKNDLKYAYNNSIDTDKYPEMAYLPDPGFFEVYPAAYDTAIKLDNTQDTSSFDARWNIGYVETDEYNENNCREKKSDILGRTFSVYKYDDENRVISNYVYVYNKDGDSASVVGFIQYTYDDKGRMASREFIPSSTKDPSTPIVYDYDFNGCMGEVRSPNRTVSFTYDSSKKTRVINMKISEPKNVADSQILVRCTYVYEHGNVVFYKEDKYDNSQMDWETLTTDTLTYDDKHHVTSFKDGNAGLYHNYKIRYNAAGQPVMRTADERAYGDTRKLPDGGEVKLMKIECRYYYEPYVPGK